MLDDSEPDAISAGRDRSCGPEADTRSTKTTCGASDGPSGYELITLLAAAWRGAVDALHRRLPDLGFDDVRPAHGFAFVRLAPDGATGTELAAHLGITKQAASQMVAELERRGYVARRPHTRSQRETLVVLTARGWACIRATEAALATVEGQWAAVLGVDALARLRTDLRRVLAGTGADARPLRPVW